MFFRYHGEEPPVVEPDDDTARNAPPLKGRVHDYPTWGEEIAMPADLVILAIGAIPSKTNALVDMLKVPVDKDRFLREIHPKVRPEGSRSTFRS
jgi:heterodisulfide reductase subunit A